MDSIVRQRSCSLETAPRVEAWFFTYMTMQPVTKPPRVDRETLRDRERRSREKRANFLAHRRATLELLESVTALVPTLQDENDDAWVTALDPDAARIRAHLVRSIQLAREKRQFECEQGHLYRILQEHRLASIVIEGILGTTSSDWEASIRQWRSITLKYFKPWIMEECLVEIEKSKKEMNAFFWSLDTESIGASFFGWHVRRRIVESQDAVQFSFEKTIYGFPMTDFVTAVWSTYTDQKTYNSVMHADRSSCWLHTVQKLASDVWIIRVVDRYAEFSMDAHTFILVSQVRTGTGYFQVVRSTHLPEVQKRTCGCTDTWTNDTVWVCYEALNHDSTDYRVHIGGTLSSHDTNYAMRWLVETLAVLIRVERVATRRGLLSNV